MKIQIEFDTWEEMQEFCGKQIHCENAAEAQLAAAEPQQNIFTAAVKKTRSMTQEETEEPVCDACTINLPPEADQPPFVEAPQLAEKEEESALTLQDVQKAVRELVKAKGKDAAKAVLSNYGATSASSVRSENYKAAVAELKEALNA